jgi:hypothetical protein
MRPMTSEKQRMEESLAGDHEAESLFDGDLKPFIQAVLGSDALTSAPADRRVKGT